MSDTIRNTIVRFALIFLFVLSGFVAVLVKIVHIQTVEKDTWETIAREHAGKDFVIAPNRGNILTPFTLIEKGLCASEEEVAANPRARSAKLRIAEKK